ncbi:MAG: hypothetical protein ACREDF_00020 [Thermoplasmata archaeon]
MNWYGILKAARKSAIDGLVTSERLSEKIGVPVRIASAWLGKFVRWGYMLREVGPGNGRRGRPPMVYRLTRWGLRFKAAGQVIEMPKPKRPRAVANPGNGEEG